MKTYTIELTEPIIHILASAFGNNDDIYHNFMNEVINEEGDTMYDRMTDEGNVSWYEDEYNKFFGEILDKAKQEEIW